MEIILEFIFGIFGEIFLQLFAEFFADLGISSMLETATPRKDRNPIFAFIGYALFGGIIGGVSLIFFPELLLENKSYAISNMIITPLIAGSMMATIGGIRRRRYFKLLRLDSFFYGYIFALSMAVTRYVFST